MINGSLCYFRTRGKFHEAVLGLLPNVAGILFFVGVLVRPDHHSPPQRLPFSLVQGGPAARAVPGADGVEGLRPLVQEVLGVRSVHAAAAKMKTAVKPLRLRRSSWAEPNFSPAVLVQTVLFLFAPVFRIVAVVGGLQAAQLLVPVRKQTIFRKSHVLAENETTYCWRMEYDIKRDESRSIEFHYLRKQTDKQYFLLTRDLSSAQHDSWQGWLNLKTFGDGIRQCRARHIKIKRIFLLPRTKYN